MANIHSEVAFIVCVLLNALFSVNIETTMSTILLLLPASKSTKYITVMFGQAVCCAIMASIFISVSLSFLSNTELFYICAVIYGLLFICSLFAIWNKQTDLVNKQMQYFDEAYSVEKKKFILENKSNKFRRKSSFDRSIREYLQLTEQRKTGSEMARVDFPIYDKMATDIVLKEQSQESLHKSDLILGKQEWTFVVLAMLTAMFIGAGFRVFGNWTILYIITKFPERSSSEAALAVLIYFVFTLFALICYPKGVNGIKIYLLGKKPKECDKKEEIIANVCMCFLNMASIAVCILWLYVPNFYMTFVVAAVCGFVNVPLAPIITITLLQTEHLEQRLLAIRGAFYLFSEPVLTVGNGKL